MKNELLFLGQLAVMALTLGTLEYLQRTRPRLMSDVGFWLHAVIWTPFVGLTLVVFVLGGLFHD